MQLQNRSSFEIESNASSGAWGAEVSLTAPCDITGRKAAAVQEMAASFSGQNIIVIEKDSRACNIKSLLGLQSLGIQSGDPISIRVYGEQPIPCLEKMKDCFHQF